MPSKAGRLRSGVSLFQVSDYSVVVQTRLTINTRVEPDLNQGQQQVRTTKTYSPIQVRAQALENTTHCLRFSTILSFACVVRVLSRLKDISVPQVQVQGRTNIYKLVLERTRWILLCRSIKFC